MIGKVTGNLIEFIGDDGFIETQSGITFRVVLPLQYRSQQLPALISVYTHHHVREDAQILYGFETRKQLELFTIFYGINGVGPKTAFTILSFVTEDGLKAAVEKQDIAYFTRIPGLGKKSALKILLELSDKMKQNFSLKNVQESPEDATVIEALKSLGFPAKDIQKVLPDLDNTKTVEERITDAIRALTAK